MLVVKSPAPRFARGQQGNLSRHNSWTIHGAVGIATDLAEAALRIDPAGQTSIGAARQGNAIFNGSKQSRSRMLPGSGALAEPAVIRHIDEKVGIGPGRLTAKLGENILEAY